MEWWELMKCVCMERVRLGDLDTCAQIWVEQLLDISCNMPPMYASSMHKVHNMHVSTRVLTDEFKCWTDCCIMFCE